MAHCRGANIVTLKQKRSLWEVLKRSGRDESIQILMHMYMEAMLGISLYSYPDLKLAKLLYLSHFCLCLLFKKLEKREEQVLPGSKGDTGREGRGEGEEMAQCVHI
jgi:hypothetical protein